MKIFKLKCNNLIHAAGKEILVFTMALFEYF
jgi:hypothetical protein